MAVIMSPPRSSRAGAIVALVVLAHAIGLWGLSAVSMDKLIQPLHDVVQVRILEAHASDAGKPVASDLDAPPARLPRPVVQEAPARQRALRPIAPDRADVGKPLAATAAQDASRDDQAPDRSSPPTQADAPTGIDPSPSSASSAVSRAAVAGKVGLVCPGFEASIRRVLDQIEFPVEASAAGVSRGLVTMGFTVDVNGQIKRVSVLHSNHPAFNRIGFKAVGALQCVGADRDVVVSLPIAIE